MCGKPFGAPAGGETFGGTAVRGSQFAAPPTTGTTTAAPRRGTVLIASVSEMPAATVLGIGLALLALGLGLLVVPALRRR